ncbi:transcriptional regulator [Opitutaceae bacterium TAV1]|nr:transcriptional regulator [Opitutaceae bacterium TAV1]
MSELSKRVTQKDIARVVGVDNSTVSLALRNHPGIPEATRERILKAAAELGYRPDPMLGALASYRVRTRPTQFHGTLAWLTNWDGWREIPHYLDYFGGAGEQAQRHGFRLEEFRLAAKGMSSERMAGILKARGISGILVCPIWTNSAVRFPWHDFASVAFGYTLATPLHMVTSAHAHACATVTKRLIECGRRRIGFCLLPTHNRRVDNNYLSAWLGTLCQAGLEAPPVFDEKRPLAEIREWIARNRIDAVISGAHGDGIGSTPGLVRMKKIGLAIPDELAMGCPSLDRADSPVSGIYENSQQIGRVATDFLVGMLHRGERGIPASRQRILVEGSWCRGTTMPA